MTIRKAIRVRKNRYTERCCARCGHLIGHLRLMASHGGDPWTCMECEWARRSALDGGHQDGSHGDSPRNPGMGTTTLAVVTVSDHPPDGEP